MHYVAEVSRDRCMYKISSVDGMHGWLGGWHGARFVVVPYSGALISTCTCTCTCVYACEALLPLPLTLTLSLTRRAWRARTCYYYYYHYYYYHYFHYYHYYYYYMCNQESLESTDLELIQHPHFNFDDGGLPSQRHFVFTGQVRARG